MCRNSIANVPQFVHKPHMTFADLLRKTRTKLGLTPPEAAQLLEVSERTVFYWESGERIPKPATRDGILSRLNKRKGVKR